MRLDLDKIKEELELVQNEFYYDEQICLQGVEDIPDPFFGCGAIKIGTSPPYGPWKKETWPGYREKDFTHPNFDLPYINSILEELNMCRTRVLILKPKQCYSIHTDRSKRIHIPVVTNENCWIILNREVIHLPANGNYYEIDTTQEHTAVNGSWENRIHLVGAVFDSDKK